MHSLNRDFNVAAYTHYTRELGYRSICGGVYAHDSDDISKITCPYCIQSLLNRRGPWPDTQQREELKRAMQAAVVELALTAQG